MLNKLFKDKGFTLVELMVVVVIIGILVAIIIPIYGNVQDNSAKRAHEANLRTIDGSISMFQAETGAMPSGYTFDEKDFSGWGDNIDKLTEWSTTPPEGFKGAEGVSVLIAAGLLDADGGITENDMTKSYLEIPARVVANPVKLLGFGGEDDIEGYKSHYHTYPIKNNPGVDGAFPVGFKDGYRAGQSADTEEVPNPSGEPGGGDN